MPAAPFIVVNRLEGENAVIAVRGEIDIATAPQVRDAIDRAVRDGFRSIVIDFRRVSFMDTTAVHLLLGLSALEDRGVRTRMIDGRPEVSRVLDLTGHRDVLPRG